MKWTDTTPYMQDGETTSRTFTTRIGAYLKVVVTRGHCDYPGEWVASVHPLFSDKPLDLPAVAKPEAAQERAMWMVGEIVHEIERHLR